MGDRNDPYFDEIPDGKPGDSAVERPRRGCLFYGCLGVLVLGAVAALLLVVATTVIYRVGSQLVEEYTATAPEPVPIIELPEAEVEAIEGRVGAFEAAARAGAPATLSLSAEDLNALIARDPAMRGRVALEIEGEQLRGYLSFPLEELGLPTLILGGLKGRYLNGTARFTPELEGDGKIRARIDELIVKGQAVPEDIVEELREADISFDLAHDDPARQEFLQRLERIEVRDGHMILTARPADSGAEETDDEPAAGGLPPPAPPTPPSPPVPPADEPSSGR